MMMSPRTGRRVAAVAALALAALGVQAAPAQALSKTFTCVQGATDTSVSLVASWPGTEKDIVRLTVWTVAQDVKLATVRMTHLDKVNNSFSYDLTVSGVHSALWLIWTFQDRYMEGGRVYCT